MTIGKLDLCEGWKEMDIGICGLQDLRCGLGWVLRGWRGWKGWGLSFVAGNGSGVLRLEKVVRIWYLGWFYWAGLVDEHEFYGSFSHFKYLEIFVVLITLNINLQTNTRYVIKVFYSKLKILIEIILSYI